MSESEHEQDGEVLEGDEDDPKRTLLNKTTGSSLSYDEDNDSEDNSDDDDDDNEKNDVQKKKKFAFKDGDNDESIDGTVFSAIVGTSIFNDNSFRAQNNLINLNIENELFSATGKRDNDNESDDNISLVLSELGSDNEETSKNKVKISQLAIGQYANTFRLEPASKLNIRYLHKKLQPKYEELIKIHLNYSYEYIPIFLKATNEIVKKQIKKLLEKILQPESHRYKIIVFMIILQKQVSQSFLQTSTCLWNQQYDKEICLRYDTKEYFSVCNIYLSYFE